MRRTDFPAKWTRGHTPLKALCISWSVLIFVVLAVGKHAKVCAQSPELSFTKKQLHDAVGQLESNLAVDLDDSEAVLKRAIKVPAFRELATSSLALVYVKRGNLAPVENFLRQANRLFPKPTPEQQNLLLRIQLNYDFANGSETATEGFSKLVHSTLNEELAPNNRLANGAMLGTMVGLLELTAAQSPIDRAVLTSAKDSLLNSKNVELVITFDSRYRKTKTHADALANWLTAHQDNSLEEVTMEAAANEEQLRVAIQDREQSATSIRQETKELRKSVYHLEKKKVAIQHEINAVLFQWNCTPEVHNPIKPDRSRITVATTEEVKVGKRKVKTRKTRLNRKGEREEYEDEEEEDVYETRRRPQRDIDRDLDAIYLPLLNRYNALLAARQAFIDRKAQYELQFRNAQTEIQAARQAIESLEEKGKHEQVEMRRLRTAVSVEREAVNALQSGRPETAFRPPNFELFDFALEAKVLQSGMVNNKE